MQRSNLPLVSLISVLVATAAWSLGSQASSATQDDIPERSECRAQLEPEVVAADSEVVVEVSFPASSGEITAVRSEEGSGIVVLGFDAVEAGQSALTARLEIPDAAAGTWWLEFDAKGRTCKALLTVTESALGR